MSNHALHEIVSCDRLRDDEVYLVSGDGIVAWRDGEAVRLDGSEKERVKRWLLREGER